MHRKARNQFTACLPDSLISLREERNRQSLELGENRTLSFHLTGFLTEGLLTIAVNQAVPFTPSPIIS